MFALTFNLHKYIFVKIDLKKNGKERFKFLFNYFIQGFSLIFYT